MWNTGKLHFLGGRLLIPLKDESHGISCSVALTKTFPVHHEARVLGVRANGVAQLCRRSRSWSAAAAQSLLEEWRSVLQSMLQLLDWPLGDDLGSMCPYSAPSSGDKFWRQSKEASGRISHFSWDLDTISTSPSYPAVTLSTQRLARQWIHVLLHFLVSLTKCQHFLREGETWKNKPPSASTW